MGIILDSGKYVIETDRATGKMTFYHNGELWPAQERSLLGNKMVYSLICRVEELEKKVTVTAGCFEAAEVEGLAQALAETTDLKLKDLVERRLMYAYFATQGVYTPE